MVGWAMMSLGLVVAAVVVIIIVVSLESGALLWTLNDSGMETKTGIRYLKVLLTAMNTLRGYM